MRRRQFWRWAAALAGATVLLAAACSGNQPTTPSSPSASPFASQTAPATTGAIAGSADGQSEAIQLGFAAADVALGTVGLTSLSIDPSVFKGGESTRGTATLTAPASPGGVVIALASDDTAASVPASITITEGATSGTFRITTNTVPSDVRIPSPHRRVA